MTTKRKTNLMKHSILCHQLSTQLNKFCVLIFKKLCVKLLTFIFSCMLKVGRNIFHLIEIFSIHTQNVLKLPTLTFRGIIKELLKMGWKLIKFEERRDNKIYCKGTRFYGTRERINWMKARAFFSESAGMKFFEAFIQWNFHES